MYYAFTPQLASNGPPGVLARGTHFFSSCRLPDTLRALWRIHLTHAKITNPDGQPGWSLLASLILDLDLELQFPSARASTDPADTGALLVIILRHRDLGCDPTGDPSLSQLMRSTAECAHKLVDLFRDQQHPAYRSWLQYDRLLTHWINTHSDVDPIDETRPA